MMIENEVVEAKQKKQPKEKLERTFEENTLYGKGRYKVTKKNGIDCTIRLDRRRYFFPAEWHKFIKTFTNDKHRLFFITLVNTGARAMEALHLKPNSFDFNRETITFDVTKQRKAKKNFFSMGTSRTFFVSSEYLKEVKKYIRDNNIDDNAYLFLNNSKLPPDYYQLSNLNKKKYYISEEISYRHLLTRKLEQCGIKDYKNFGLHALRKTYGNWMRAYGIGAQDLVFNLGHDWQTYSTNYGSSLIFTSDEEKEIKKILGTQKSVALTKQ